jgi:hypothetical protein
MMGQLTVQQMRGIQDLVQTAISEATSAIEDAHHDIARKPYAVMERIAPIAGTASIVEGLQLSVTTPFAAQTRSPARSRRLLWTNWKNASLRNASWQNDLASGDAAAPSPLANLCGYVLIAHHIGIDQLTSYADRRRKLRQVIWHKPPGFGNLRRFETDCAAGILTSEANHERVRKRPRLAAEIADILNANADFLVDFPCCALF